MGDEVESGGGRDARGRRRGGITSCLERVAIPLVALVMLALAACNALSQWHGIIKVAVVAPYSGPLTSEGLSMLAGARLAAEEIDQSGGVGGYRVVVVAPDERSSVALDDVAADPDVVAVVGHVVSDSARVGRKYRDAGLIWLAAEPVDRESGIYPLVAGPDLMSRALRRYLTSRMDTASDSPDRVVAICRTAMTAGGTKVEVGGVDVICAGASDRFEAAMNANPTSRVVCVAAWCNAPELERWSSDKGFDYIVPTGPPADTAAWDRLARQLGGTGPVLSSAAIGYDGVRIVAEAASRAANRGTLTRAAIAQEVLATAFSGVLGPYGHTGPTMAVVEVRRFDGPGATPLVFRVEETP